MTILKLEFDIEDHLIDKKDSILFFVSQSKYLILLTEDGNSKTLVLK